MLGFNYLGSNEHTKLTAVMILCLIFIVMINISVYIIQPTQAAVITVDDDGSAMFTNIQDAINISSNGDTIYISNGTYLENIFINKSINLTGESIDGVIINGSLINPSLSIEDVNFINITNLSIRGGTNGLKINSSSNVSIENVIISENYNGIFINESDNITILRSNIISNIYFNTSQVKQLAMGVGIYINTSSGIVVKQNNISMNWYKVCTNPDCAWITVGGYGTSIKNSDLISIIDNNMLSNIAPEGGDSYGIEIESSFNITIANNTIVNHNYNIKFENSNSGIIIGNNLYEGHYYIISLIDSDDISMISNIIVNFNNDGISIGHGSNNKIISNEINMNYGIGSGIGINIYESSNNYIGKNIVEHGKKGIVLNGMSIPSKFNLISNNTVDGNTREGILVSNQMSDNSIINNSVKSNLFGIRIINKCNDNLIMDNGVVGNDYGISIQQFSNRSRIFHNNIINNNIQAEDNGLNFWNESYPSGGNFWSDYFGIDLNSTPLQNVPPPDGIGDTHYVIDVDSQDYYPLMELSNEVNPPLIDDLTVIPNPQEINSHVNISVEITDNLDLISSVRVNISDPYNINLGNFTMNYDPINERYYYNNTYSVLGKYEFTIWTNDTSDNLNSMEGDFSIQDTIKPWISDVVALPSIQEVYNYVNISAVITDNLDMLYRAWVRINDPNNAEIENVTMNYDPLNDRYYYNTTYSITGIHSFTIWSNDTCGNWNSTGGQFHIQDSIKPSISDITVLPNPQEVHGNVNISVMVDDIYQLFDVWINITDPYNFALINQTMNFDIVNNRYYYNAKYATIGNFTLTIWANDTSNNWNFLSNQFTIQDTTKPQANAGSDLEANVNDRIIFNGSESTDNYGIMNYTWRIVRNGNIIATLYGINPTFTFNTPGSYSVILNVTDFSGNFDKTAINVNVLPQGFLDQYWWILIIIVILSILIIYFVIRNRKKKAADEKELEEKSQEEF